MSELERKNRRARYVMLGFVVVWALILVAGAWL